MTRHTGSLGALAVLTVLGASVLAGCGGGGGGGGSATQVVTLSGNVSTTGTSNPANTTLAQRAVTVQGTSSLTATTDTSGNYTIPNVPAGTSVTLLVNDNACGGAQIASQAVTVGSSNQTVNIQVQYDANTQAPPWPCGI